MRKPTRQVMTLLASLLSSGALIMWADQFLPDAYARPVTAVVALLAIFAQALMPALREPKPTVDKVAKTGLLIIAVMLASACTSRIVVKQGQKETLQIKTSAPSHVRYYLDGKLKFERTGNKALPLKCAK